MIKRIVAVLVLMTTLNFLVGCTCCQRLRVDEIKSYPEGKITHVFLKSGESIEFDDDGGRIDEKKHVVAGYQKDEKLYGTLFEYEYDEIAALKYRYVSASKSIVIVTLTVTALAGLILGLDRISEIGS